MANHAPGDLVAEFVEAFNAQSADAVDALYEPGSVLVPRAGQAVTGTDRGAAIRHLMSFGLPMAARPRHTFVSGDIALLIVDWSIRGPNVDLAGSAADVARRGPDGRWRYVVDNPHGTA